MLFKKIIAVFCSIAISFSVMAAPVVAADIGTIIAGAGVAVDFFSFAADMYDRWKAANPDAPDSEYPGFNPGGSYGGGAGRDDLPAAYSDYVGTLPATGYTSTGGLLWYPTPDDFCWKLNILAKITIDNDHPQTAIRQLPFKHGGLNAVFDSADSGRGISWTSGYYSYAVLQFVFVAPFTGSYRATVSPSFSGNFILSDGQDSLSGDYERGSSSRYSQGDTLPSPVVKVEVGRNVGSDVTSMAITFHFPVYEVIPDSALAPDAYSTTTRPTSISGGNYGVVGDNNEIAKVEDNSTIVNETNNTYYNPATGATVPITDWSYDYSDRSYKVTMESGDTATITYGDENISIEETNTVSGDTVTNNYTIYYLVDAPETPVDPDCTHEWAETSTTPSTCTVPGSRLLTCSLCSQTKTESIPALGHDWEVKKTVNTQYDETGQLTQQGYTLYECATCHEQYKSEDGTLPPAVNPDTGTDLAAVDALKEKLKIAADALLGIFDKLPELFTGFTDFLAAVFPFVPPEFITIFELGLFLLIAAAALRKFLS